jgi:acyl-CoA hydrolase/RimJ/RimL family protein N-acetyltransferase
MKEAAGQGIAMNIAASMMARTKTAAEALSHIKSGDRVFVGSACATPQLLVRTLEETGAALDDVKLVHFLTSGAIPMVEGKPKTRFQHKIFFVGSNDREAVKLGKAHYIPISIAHLPALIGQGKVPIDVALIQVSAPNEHGFVSLGVSVDITLAAVLKARIVIAELNPNMPFTHGASSIPLEKIDYLVPVDTPVTEYIHDPADKVAQQIARYVARIISDDSTLHIGLGKIPNEMLKYLSNRKNLGIHSDVITEPIVDLIQNGVITGEKKSNHQCQVVTSFCMGTKRLYNFINNNPAFSFQPIDYICKPELLAGNSKLVSITQAFALDLMGQVCADQFGGEFYSGVSTQPDFLRGAASSPGGKPIICLSSTTDDGKESRIRPLLREGEGVTIARSDVHYVITEYGIAYLFCKSIQERALALIEIAHPSFRPWLLEEGIRLGYLRSTQTLRSKVAYPEEEEQEYVVKNGEKILVRPSKASDVQGLQDIFYNLRPEDVYTRFFTHLTSFTESKAQHLCNVDYENEMAFIAVTGDRENETVIGSSCYFWDQTDNLGEVAYMIRPEWQKMGVGSALQQRMAEYAKSKGLRGFKADILTQNEKMHGLINKGEKVSMTNHGDTNEVIVLFD